MRLSAVAVGHVLPEQSAEMRLVEHNQTVETLAADRPDHQFSERVRLTCRDRCQHGLDPDRPCSLCEVTVVAPVAVSDEEQGPALHGVASMI